jgi:hypothetical protein
MLYYYYVVVCRCTCDSPSPSLLRLGRTLTVAYQERSAQSNKLYTCQYMMYYSVHMLPTSINVVIV